MSALPPLHPLEGHASLRSAVARSFHANRLPSTLLLHGPPGVGKQRFALWVGQLLLCDAPTPEGPCDTCRHCRMVSALQHPDLLWYFPVERPRSRGSREREEEALEEARNAELQRIREAPLRPSWSEEVRGLHFGTIRRLRREASHRPAAGPRRLFLIAQAEELVAQDSSQAAANALLKTLEEPAPDTWFILTSSEPGRLLPTIRSRATALHFPPLPADHVRDFLRSRTGAAPEALEKAVALSGGSIGRALGFLPDGEADGPLDRIRKDAFRLLRAAVERGPAERFLHALDRAPAGARGMQELLSSLQGWIRDLAAVAAFPDTRLLNVDAREWLLGTVRSRGIHPALAARALVHVERARESAAGNVNPQLLVGTLLRDLHLALTPPPTP